MTPRPSAPDSLPQRLAISRLAGPGMLDRSALQRARERFASPATTHALDRLGRHIVPATPGTESLPLVRIDRSVDRDVAAPTNAVDGPASSASLGGERHVMPTAPMRDVNAFAVNLIARHTPSIGRTTAFVARRSATMSGITGGLGAAQGILNNSKTSGDTPSAVRPSLVTGVVAKGMLQRVANGDGGRPARAGESESTTPPALRADTGATSMVMRSASPPSAPSSIGAPEGSPTASPLPHVSTDVVARSSEPVLRRKSVAAQIPASPTVPTAQAGAPPVAKLPAIAAEPPAPRRSGITGPLPLVPTGGPLPRVSARSGSHTSPSLLWRKGDVAAGNPVASPFPMAAASPTSSFAPTNPTQLVLRKSVNSSGAGPAPHHPPATTPVTARPSDMTSATPHADRATYSPWDVDWITEQVSRRLARRLEIERERMGVRRWR
jgi:hypothetical protein